MSYLNQDPQEETCHEVMAIAKINMKKRIPFFRYEAHIILIRLLLGCMTLFCGTLRELRQSCLLSTLRLPTPACTRFSLENDGSTTLKNPRVSLKEEIKQLLNLQASSEVAASILKNEVDELKQTKVEGLSEDPEMRLDFGSISSRGIKHDRQTPTMH